MSKMNCVNKQWDQIEFFNNNNNNKTKLNK